MIQKGSLAVRPSAVIFRDLEPGEKDSIEILARNVGKRPIHVRYSVPENPCFSLVCRANIMTAPGLDAHATLRYKSVSMTTEKCELKVECNDATILIPITAYPPSPFFEFDKTKLNFGNILVNSSQIQHFTMKNCGTTDGNFVFECSDSDANIEPITGILRPNESIKVAVTLKSVTVGSKHFTITPKIEGHHDSLPVIEAFGEILCHSVGLVGMDGKPLTELEFGYLFHGQKKSLKFRVANNGGLSRKFTIDKLSSSGPRIFSVSPMSGDLPPYQSMEVTVTYAPPPNFSGDDIEEVMSSILKVNIVETGRVMEISLVGTAVKIGFEISALDFDFDTVIVKRKTEKIFTVTNKSKYLPLPFQMKSVAHFSFVPESGNIPQEKSQDIVMTFYPRNLGPFSYKTFIMFCNGICQKEMNIDGFVVTDKDTKDFKRAEVWEQSSEAAWYVNHPASKFGLTLQEIQAKKEKRKEYDAYISDAAKRRAERNTIRTVRKHAIIRAKQIMEASKAKFTEKDIQEFVQTQIRQQVLDGDDPVNLGLQHCEGMIPPDPPLLRIAEPLGVRKFGTNPRCFTASTGTRQKPFDDKVLIKKKFKPSPTTKLEISECAKKLQQDQRLLVVASQQTIDFGTISVHSRDIRSFQVTNNLQFHILVAMTYDCEELKDSTPTSQVVPPHQTCGFDIVFSSESPQKFNHSIKYVINNDLVYSVNVVANVVPIDVSITPEVLVFEFPADYARPYIKQFVTLQNNSTTVAEFSWSGFDSVFTNHNMEGTIVPHGKYKAEITYRPDYNPHAESSAVLSVKSGPSRTLKMIGNTGKAKFVLNKKSLAFGLIPLDVPKVMDLRIKNNGPDDGIFSITPNLTDVLVITPASGRVKVGEQTDIHVRVNCMKPGAFEIPVSVAVCGTLPLSFTVTGQAELPRVTLKTENMDFGLVYIGGSVSRSITLENVGLIPAVAFVNLTKFPDFHLDYDTKLNNNADSDKKNSVALVTDTRMDLSRSESIASFSSTCSIDTPNSKATGFIYRLTVIPQSSITFSLVFQPRTADSYSFELPVSVASISVDKELKPIITAKSLRAPLFLSESSINFGVCPLHDSDNPNNRPPLRSLSIKNEYKQDVQYRVGQPSSGEFAVEPMTGTVKYATSSTVFITFRPTSAIPFSCVMPVYVTTENGEVLVSEIQLSGIGSYRRFAPSVSYLSLPVVPLGVKSERTIRILNSGSVRAELKTDMPIVEKQFPLSVQFVEGNLFDFSTRYLPLKVSFCSQKPMSLQTIVAIVDDQGHTASFTVSAATDNSIFTLYPILSMRSYKIASGQGKPITATLTPGDLDTEFLANVTACDDFSKLKPSGKTVSHQLKSLLVRYLNSAILSTKIKRFPDDVAANGEEIVMEIITTLAGGKKLTTGGSTTTNSKGSKKVTQMKQFLQFLKTQGAILPNVSPEFLLQKKDFTDVMRARIMNQLLGLDYYGAPDMSSYGHVVDEYISSSAFTTALVPRLKVIDDLFKTISTEAWTQVILQVLKLYLFAKIDTDKLAQVPGVSAALDVIRPAVDNVMFAEISRPPKALSGSNVFSAPECALLKWVTIHYCASHGGYSDIVNDFTQLRNPKYFVSLLKSHMKKCDIDIGEETDDMDVNVTTILEALNQIKVPFIPNVVELTQGSHISLALILYEVFESLPHFIPSTDVVFNVKLSSREVQRISVTNPSNKGEMTYRVSLTGSPNFRILSDTIVLEPSQTADIEVEYFGRVCKSEQAVLMFVPEKPKIVEPKETRPQTAPSRRTAQRGKVEPVVNPSTVVVTLQSNVTVNGPTQIINVEGPIYQTTKLSFVVKNAAQYPGTYHVIPMMADVSQDRKNVPGILKKLLKNPFAVKQYPEQPTLYDSMLLKHQNFLFVQKTVAFEDSDSTERIDLEFIPISLGEFHCFLLFYNENHGEFVYEIVGKSGLPQPQNMSLKVKTEAGKKQTQAFNIEPINKFLFQAVGYALTREASLENYMSDVKFQDTVAFHVRELQNLYTNMMNSLDFEVENTAPEYFHTPETFTLKRVINLENPSKNQNVLPIDFAPTAAGDYPCRIIMKSKYDVRLYSFTAVSIAATKFLSLDMTTMSGRPVTQEIPYVNPSEEVWHFKVSLKGSDCFTVPNTFSAEPNSTGILPVSMKAGKIGKYSAEMTVVNIQKETVYKYTINGEVTDPSAEEKILVECRAREKHTQVFNLKPFIQNGILDVTSTVPLLNCPKQVEVRDGELVEPFEVMVYASRSGISTGTVTFTDRDTHAYSWYVVDLRVDPPIPEETLPVKTFCRKTVTVNIPISNPKNCTVNIDVIIDDAELYGEKSFTIGPNESKIYSLVFSPLIVSKRQSTIAFMNSEEGEFLYVLDINVEQPDPCVMSQMVASIGKYASTLVLLENPIDSEVWMTVSNDNPSSFNVVTEENKVKLAPLEKRQVEIRYIPSSVGAKETCVIGFKSSVVGDWYYRMTGIGKPPAPLSPVIVEALLELSSSGQIMFTNPFPKATRYEVLLTTEDRKVFQLLTKRKHFVLSHYGEQYQIAFSFSPTTVSQFHATVLVTTVGLQPEVRWTFPIIGNTLLGSENETPPLKGKTGEKIVHKLEFPLVGEQEEFKESDYTAQIEHPSGYEWIKPAISVKDLRIDRREQTPKMFVTLECLARKPANIVSYLIITNPMEQKWKFPFRTQITRSGIMKTLVLESPLNCLTRYPVIIDEQIPQRTHFTVDFAPGSSEEFQLNTNEGVLEASLQQHNVIPIEILFQPTTYGKHMKGVLIIETIDVEYIIEVIGRFPSYVPPVITKSGKVDTSRPESARRIRETTSRKRNYIKDNIEKAKLSRPCTVRSSRAARTPFRY